MTSNNATERPLQGHKTEQQPTFEEFLARVSTVIGNALANGDVNTQNTELVELLEILASARIDGECQMLDEHHIGQPDERFLATSRLRKADPARQVPMDLSWLSEEPVVGRDGELVIVEMEPVEITVNCPNQYIALEVLELIDEYFDEEEEDFDDDPDCEDDSHDGSDTGPSAFPDECPYCGGRFR